MLLIATKPLGMWFGVGAEDMESGSQLDRAVLSGILCLGLLILTKRRFVWANAIKENIFLMLLLGYMLISIFWSDMPLVSFKRWVREFIAIVMAFMVATELDPKKALESIFRRTIYVLIPFSYILIHYFPKYGRAYGRWSGIEMWIGVTQQKNGLGRLCIIAAFFIVWTLVRRWQGRDIPVGKYQIHAQVFILIITLWLLKGSPNSYSASAIAALALGLAAFVRLLWMKRHRINLKTNIFVAMLALGITFGIVTVFSGGSTVANFTSTLGRDETLTGRTEVWATLLPVAMRQPIVGHGFGGFWTPATREMYDISEGHSGYLDVLLELGFVGLLLFSMFLLSSCRKAQRALAHDFDWASLWICYLLMAVLHNVTESSLNSFTSQLMAVVLFIAVSSTAAISYTLRESHEKRDISQPGIF